MTVFARAPQAAIAAVTALILAGPAAAQQDRPNFFDNLFGNNNAPSQAAGRGGADEADLTVQINQLQQQVRQLTGTIEQLQYRNQQLEQQLRVLQGNAGGAPVPGPTASTGTAYPANPPSRGMQQQPMQQDFPQRGMQQPQQDYPQRGMQQPQQDYPQRGMQQPQQDYPPRGMQQSQQQDYPPPAVIAATPGSGRGDVFDPSQHPNAPGAPRQLGSPDSASQPVGAPYGRNAGAPLDLSVPGSRPVADDQGMLPPPPPRNPNATGAQLASVAPTATPRDEFDLAYGYVQRKDYALAEDSLRAFLKKYPSDGRAADAQYWLGESLYQRQRYRDAAESFLAVSTKFDRNPKAPESLLRLGQSLAALGEKETACAAWGEIGRKYANASVNVKKNVAAEQKRVRC